MKLHVVAGYREFFLPDPIAAADLAEVLRDLTPGGVVPSARWRTAPSAYHTFLYDEGERDRRVPLFLEYLGDALAPDATAVVVLPFESAIEPPGDARVEHFVAAARAAFGAVTVRRLHPGAGTLAVLRGLRARLAELGASAPPTARIADSDEALLRLGALGAVQHNYSAAVLRLCDQLVARESVFAAGPEREAHLAWLLEQQQLLIRTDLDADQVLAEARPGGQLFALLSRPLQVPVSST